MPPESNATYADIIDLLEALSLEIVMADPSDPEAFRKSLSLLKSINGIAKDQHLPAIAREASGTAKLIQKIRKKEMNTDQAMTALNRQMATLNFLADPDEGVSDKDIDDDATLEKYSGISTSEICNSSDSQDSVRHPGHLPPHLSMEDFELFLVSKVQVLEEIESLILELENGDLDKPPREIKRLIHTMKGEAGFLGLNRVEQVCHHTEDLLLSSLTPEAAQVFLRVKDWLFATFAFYRGEAASPEKADTLISALEQWQNRIDASTDTLELPKDSQPKTNPDENGSVPSSNGRTKRPVQIDPDRLDYLIDIIGELAIAQAMVSAQHTGATGGRARTREAAQAFKALEESTKTLQKIGLSLRMVPLKPLFNRMRRVARDLALKQNKKLRFIVEGELTELDKTLVDGLADPLIHIIRNSIDHGIENDLAHRLRQGKPETATVTLKGYHEGASLVIEVTDDGRGIDRARLLKKATAAGIVDNAAQDDPEQMDETAVLHLIFHPGLSTATKVTDISGRGVGMDVVKTTISEFNGRIVLSSEQGKGTRVAITLPLTLAIMDGMIITSASNRYVIPTLSIITALRLTPDIRGTAMGGHPYIKFQEAIVPLVNLQAFMNLATTDGPPCDPIVVVVEDGGRQAGILVDEVVAKQSIVRKNLSGMLGEVPGVSGATIMADGRVCLILDVQALVGAAHGQVYSPSGKVPGKQTGQAKLS
ncbi:MAG TPA: hypothetical protein DHV36_24545 [Desulfobacteraceae bacterium]|nr:hypothetical protein [Desulfobacteraceae bacterium]